MSRLVFPWDTSFRISFCLGVSPSDRFVRTGAGFMTFASFLFLVVEAALAVFAGFLA